jgi:hypothetical protein
VCFREKSLNHSCFFGWGASPPALEFEANWVLFDEQMRVFYQDVAAYVGEVTMAALQEGDARVAALNDQRARQRAFLKRSAPGVDAASWRPKKRHRRCAFQVSCHMHNVFLM